MNHRQHPPAFTGQTGAAALLVVLLLLLGMTVIVVTASRTGMVEQQITGNDIRAREAQEAAEAGLEYAISWATQNPINATMTCPGDANCPSLVNVPDMTPNPDTGKPPTSSGETYAISTLTFTKVARFIKVSSIAQGVNDNSITAKSEAYIEARTVLSDGGSFPPPMAIAGCLTAAGTPDIYPNWTDSNNDGEKAPNELGNAIITSQPEYVGTPPKFCLNYCGPSDHDCDAAAAGTGEEKPHLDLNNGHLANNQAFPNNSIWDYYFAISQAEFKAVAETTLSTAGGLYWMTSTGNWAGGTYGSANDPVIIVFEYGCPKPTGNTTVYGILFFLESNGCVTNPMNGWGNVTVWGSVGVNGGVVKINANLAIHGVGDGTGMPNVKSPTLDAMRIPGTWNDFLP